MRYASLEAVFPLVKKKAYRLTAREVDAAFPKSCLSSVLGKAGRCALQKQARDRSEIKWN